MAITLLWADQEHLWAWNTSLQHLEKRCGFRVKQLHSIRKKDILNNCVRKQILVMHCGTIEPMANLRDVLQAVKARFPNIKVGLETNCRHPLVEELVDFYVVKPLTLDELEEVLKDALK